MDLLSRLPCGVLSFDADGRILYVNETFLAMIGREREEVETRNIDVIFPRGGRIFFQTHFIPLLRMHGHFEEVYFELQKGDGERVPVLINASQRKDDSGPQQADCVFVAVAQRGQYESAILEARREAEKANQAKTRFLSMVSHDLRTPLQAISGYAEALARELHGPLTPGQKEDVDAIRSASGELKRLIEDILNFATLESGNVAVAVREVEVSSALERAAVMIRTQMAEKQIDFTLESEVTAIVRADPDRLQQILLNLLTNAVKFTPAGGRITTGFHADASRGTIFVSDTGKGIAPDDLETIFEPFSQVDPDAVELPHRGVGLGLSISRELARAMGGELLAESTLGSGSTFSIELPLLTT